MNDDQLRAAITSFAIGLLVYYKPAIAKWWADLKYQIGFEIGRAIALRRSSQLRRK
jgi:hypothetical protein